MRGKKWHQEIPRQALCFLLIELNTVISDGEGGGDDDNDEEEEYNNNNNNNKDEV